MIRHLLHFVLSKVSSPLLVWHCVLCILVVQVGDVRETDPSVPSKEDIPTFDEWKKQVMEVEKEKSKSMCDSGTHSGRCAQIEWPFLKALFLYFDLHTPLLPWTMKAFTIQHESTSRVTACVSCHFYVHALLCSSPVSVSHSFPLARLFPPCARNERWLVKLVVVCCITSLGQRRFSLLLMGLMRLSLCPGQSLHTTASGSPHPVKKVQKNFKNNYASVECGAKILSANNEAKVKNVAAPPPVTYTEIHVISWLRERTTYCPEGWRPLRAF